MLANLRSLTFEPWDLELMPRDANLPGHLHAGTQDIRVHKSETTLSGPRPFWPMITWEQYWKDRKLPPPEDGRRTRLCIPPEN
jgi:hypothetical protein